MASQRLLDLEAKHKALADRIRRERGKLKGAERKEDTRRKVLAGAAVLNWAERDADFAAQFQEKLGRFLTKPADRLLFKLPVENEAKSA